MTQPPLALTDRIAVEVRQSPVKAIALAALFIVAACVWGPKFFASSKAQAPPIETPTGAADVAGAPPATEFASRDPIVIHDEFVEISKEAHELRRIAEERPTLTIGHDPFRPLVRAPVSAAPVAAPTSAAPETRADDVERDAANALVLSGVMVFGKGRAAVIDGRLVRTGDRVRDFEVTAVDARRVELKGAHGTYVLSMDRKDSPAVDDSPAPHQKERQQ